MYISLSTHKRIKMLRLLSIDLMLFFNKFFLIYSSYNGNPIKTNGYRFLYLGKDKNFI